MTELDGQRWKQMHRKHELVWDALHELGIQRVSVDFSGSGDNGQIDDCCPQRANEYAAFGAMMLMQSSGQAPVKLRDAIVELSDEILQKNEIPDWYNNDGGYGTIEWIVAHTDKEGVHRSDRINVTVNVARIEFDTSDFEYDRFGNSAGAE